MAQAQLEDTAILGSTRQRGGKYLTFVLAEEEYGLEILKVREINGLMPITPVPRTPDFVEGVINLRGKVIPVIDLRTKFGMDRIEATEQTCIIVVDDGRIEMGIIVDKVSEVLDIAADDIEDPPSFGVSVETDFILGMGKAGDRVTILLDISRVLSTDDLRSVQAVSAAETDKTQEA
jgi:purine-binding chemotaxis protein CheW